MNTTALKDYTTTASAGYMGTVKTTGSKSHKFLYGAELSKEVKKALQEVLSPDLKKSQVTTKIKTYTGGQHLTITLKLDRAIYAPTVSEYADEIKDRVRHNKYNWIWTERDGEPVQVFHDAYYMMSEEEQKNAEEATARQEIKYNYEREDVEINHYHISDEPMLNDAGRDLVKVANTVILAFNYDDSNSMVDYFDTNFYYDIKIKWMN